VAKREWQVKAAITNGPDSRELLVAWRGGRQIIATACGTTPHSTFHLDGRRHIAVGPKRGQHAGVRLHDRPDQLVGVEELHVMSLRNEAVHFSAESPLRPLDRGKYLVWEIDSRKLQPGVSHSLRIGVVGSGGHAELAAYINELTTSGDWAHVRTEVHDKGIPTPWPYLVVLQATREGVPGSTSQGGIIFSADSPSLRDGQPYTMQFPKGTLGNFVKEVAAEFPPEGAEWTMQEAIAIVLSPDAPPYVKAGDLALAVRPISSRPRDLASFVLLINPSIETWYVRVGEATFTAIKTGLFPGMRVVRMDFGPPGRARCRHDFRGTTYYIQCVGVSGSTNSYRFRVWWAETGTPA
jgi:hypothetical protein